MGKEFKIPRAAGPTVLVVSLIALGAASALVGVVGAVAYWPEAPTTARAPSEAGLWAMARLLAGLSGAGLLFALAWLIRRQHEAVGLRWRMLSTLKAIMQSQVSEVPIAPAIDERYAQLAPPEVLDELLDELRELNANMLLSDKQLQIKRAHRQQQATEMLTGRIAEAIEAGRFRQAEGLLEKLKAQVPDEPQHGQLIERLAQARAKSQADDIAAAGNRTEDLLAVGAFEQAERVAQELLDKHPASPEAIALLDHVTREGKALVAEQRRTLYAELERHVEKRQWRQAVTMAKQLLAAHPGSPEADAVTAQMATLGDNAKLEEARQLRDQVLDLLNRKRYGEALRAAVELTERFPETQAASELREQIPKLEELAHEQGH